MIDKYVFFEIHAKTLKTLFLFSFNYTPTEF